MGGEIRFRIAESIIEIAEIDSNHVFVPPAATRSSVRARPGRAEAPTAHPIIEHVNADPVTMVRCHVPSTLIG
ncbi:hypothetical protein Ade02nite_82620 [Paractinoplanes deccanensis]|uniref:Uncharacterized protein n=1 Tax=Paractinoplanes deccanensis TaxID=113561 RepID=A0ABQ3YHY8_9ACTN|nr:hypothetical protein Ade02nite_82620 [Actinoplanes deccanensis]